MTTESLIFDFETLSLERHRCVILSLAVIKFDESRFLENPYEWEELIESARCIKFDVKNQVQKYNRHIDEETVNWWSELPEDAKKASFYPSENDQPLESLYDFMKDIVPQKLNQVYSRGNTFDPIVLDYALKDINKPDLWPYYKVKDTRSLILGLSYGANIKDNFMPEGYESKFVHHDPIHDIAIDVIRIQYLAQIVNG